MTRLAVFNASAFLILMAFAPAGAEEFPAGPNMELVEENCTACHSAKLVLQNRMTRDGWQNTIRWMQKTQGLWEFDPEDEKKILDYLATYLNPETTEAPEKLPWLLRWPRPSPLLKF